MSTARKTNFIETLGRFRNILLAFVFIFTQLILPLSVLTESAQAAGTIDVSSHQGQLKDGVNGNLLGYTTGSSNITTYTELDSINFRFDIEADGDLDGQMQIEFTSNDTGCLFFDGSFELGTHDNSAQVLTNVSGSQPSVSTIGTPINNGDDWTQVLEVDFDGSESATVNYYLTLSDEAGECSSGSPQHSRLANGPEPGDFKNIGNQNIPIPSKKIIELPEIFIEKWVDRDGDGVAESKATAGEWFFSLDEGAPEATDANGEVVFTNVTPDGNHTITESGGPLGQTFLNGGGTYCTFTQSTATANVAAGSTAKDATCIFNNGVAPGKIKIIKNAVPNNLTDFGFTSTGTGTSNFILDDDSGVAGADDDYSNQKEFTGLTVGEYTFTESSVSGWDLEDISCTGQGAVTDEANRRVTINLSAGGDVTCTFKNRQQGQVVVTKQTLPDGDSTVFPVKISGNNTIHSSATQNVTDGNSVTFTVSQGTFDVNETVPSGWSVDESECQNLSVNGNTPLVNGVPTVSCTITNTKLATLTILKEALPKSDVAFNFETMIGVSDGDAPYAFALVDKELGPEEPVENAELFKDLQPGTYSVTELFGEGWKLTDLSCTIGQESFLFSQDSVTDNEQNIIGEELTVTLAAGQEVDCTFTNTQLLSIGGIKYIWSETGSLQPADLWSFTLEELIGDQYVQVGESIKSDETGAYEFDGLLPGITYRVSEVIDQASDWVQLYPFMDYKFTLAIGGSIDDADFTNFETGAVSGHKWNDADGDGQKSEDESKLEGWEITLQKKNTAGEWEDFDTTETNEEGEYSFSGLTLLEGLDEQENTVYSAPEYRVCEEDRSPDWEQTFPASNEGCHEFTVTSSGQVDDDLNFGNRGFGRITVEKTTITASEDATIFEFDIDSIDYDDTYTIGSISVTGEDTESTEPVRFAAGTYEITEDVPESWILLGSSCSTEEATDTVTVRAGSDVTCTFINQELAAVNVTKFNDFDGNGLWDNEIEPTLTDWEMTLACEAFEETNGVSPTVAESNDLIRFFPPQTCFSENVSSYELLQTIDNEFTGDNGVATFNDLLAGSYVFGEVDQAGWQQTGIHCEIDNEIVSGSQLSVLPGQTYECFIGNAQDLVLNLDKENDTPEVTRVGAVVTYTLTVSVPNDSGISYDTVVTDLAPENFQVDNSTARARMTTASVNRVGTFAYNSNPTYASPGSWDLGTMYPGEVVELTYEAQIQENVTPGTYPDIAYATGLGEESDTNTVVYSNVHLASADDPFVGTDVTVAQEQGEVLGVQTLARTGAPMLWEYAALPMALIILAGALLRRDEKGAF